MELHPILEENVNPAPNLWYVVSAFGDRPSLRVGHTATTSSTEEKPERVLIVGGANPSETFSDIHTLDLSTLSWNMTTPAGFVARYEHVAFVPASHPDKIYVLLGANQENNISEVQCYNMTTEKWSTIKTSGSAPTPRTHHSTASVNDCVYFFSGGKSGAEPVQDRQVFCFNASNNSWQSLAISGDSPSPRHGHTICVIGGKLYCFGGMAGTKFYNDVHVIDLEKGMWSTPKIKKRNSMPEARTAHAAVAHGADMYVFGGLNKDGMAMDDLWKLDTGAMQWTQLQYEGPPPACRLDMASCVISWKAGPAPSLTDDQQVDSVAESLERTSLSTPEGDGAKSAAGASAEVTEDDSTCKLLLIHGGMDTQGEIFDDCLVYRIS